MKYMLNPAYLLRQDGNRVILFYRDDIKSNGEEWFTFIHPFQACMLSFFKGKESFDKELEKCSQFFQIPFEKMRGIISPFINNPKWFAISQRDGHSICFPKNMLIEKKKAYSASSILLKIFLTLDNLIIILIGYIIRWALIWS